MTNNSLGEHRLERRLPGLDTSVQIRRRGLGYNPWRADLDLVDLSANGMALISPTLKLEALQKIDFELTSGRRTTAGCAVVCYAGNKEGQPRYGFLFIETDAEFDSFLTGESLSSNEVQRLGEELAEQFMQRRRVEGGGLFDVQNQRMVDAVNALAQRLGQMGLYIIAPSGEVILPVDSLVVDKSGGLSLPMKDASSGEIVRKHISLLPDADSSGVLYQIDGAQGFSNIIDLLDHLCLCFDQISQS